MCIVLVGQCTLPSRWQLAVRWPSSRWTCLSSRRRSWSLTRSSWCVITRTPTSSTTLTATWSTRNSGYATAVSICASDGKIDSRDRIDLHGWIKWLIFDSVTYGLPVNIKISYYVLLFSLWVFVTHFPIPVTHLFTVTASVMFAKITNLCHSHCQITDFTNEKMSSINVIKQQGVGCTESNRFLFWRITHH